MSWLPIRRLPALAAAALASLPNPATAGPIRFEPVSVLDAAQCSFNEVRLAPDGMGTAIWLNRRPALVSPSEKFRQSQFAIGAGSGRLMHYRVAGELSALHWTRTPGQLEFLIDGTRWVRLDVAKMYATDVPIDSRWYHVNVRSDRWGGLGLLFKAPQSRAWLDAGVRPVRLFQTALAGDNPVFVHVDADSLSVRSTSAAADFGLPFDVSELASGSDATIDVPKRWQRIVRDPANGSLVGKVSPSGVEASTSEETTVAMAADNGLFKDAERVDGHWALLGADADGVHWLDRHDGSQRVRMTICGDGQGVRPMLASSLFSSGSGSSDFAGTYHRQVAAKANEVLVVRFHGGPFASVNDDYPAPVLRRLVRAGLSVVEPDYPGSRGFQIKRAPRLDASAISEANDALVTWARRQGYHRWLVVGESLGALPALDLVSRYPKESVGVLLLAPLVVLAVDTDLGGRPLGTNRLQTLAEQTAFGKVSQRARLSKWLEQRVARICQRGDYLIIVGSEDRVTPKAGQPSCLADATMIVPNATHGSVIDDERTWERALPWMTALTVPVTDPAHGG